MAASYDFVQLDVFTRTALTGNPLAVFIDGRGLTDEEMQAELVGSGLKLQRVYAFVERRMTCALVLFRIPC
jgi:hypothetical protein